MKTEIEIRKRLEKLRVRYCRKYCADVSGKKPRNCVYNIEHAPVERVDHVPTEVELAPRVTTTLVVIQPDFPIRLCMYGSEKPDTWNGDVCDDDATAHACPYFEPKIPEDRAVEEFDKLMSDDEFVLENYRDIASLQWVLNERVHLTPLSTLDKVKIWFDRFFRGRRSTKLLSEKTENKPEDHRNADDENS